VEEEDGGADLNAMKPDEEFVNNSHLDLQGKFFNERSTSHLAVADPGARLWHLSNEVKNMRYWKT